MPHDLPREARPGRSRSTPITLHRHQADAVRAAGSGASYVLTTGTGSGKSLACIVPIVDRVLREGSGQRTRPAYARRLGIGPPFRSSGGLQVQAGPLQLPGRVIRRPWLL